MNDLRLRFLSALASAGIVALPMEGCGGIAPTAVGDAGTPGATHPDGAPLADGSLTSVDASVDGPVIVEPDGALPPVTCQYGKPASQCFTHDQLVSVYTMPPMGGDIADGGGIDAASASWDQNGCLPPNQVEDGCCNPALAGPSFNGAQCCYTFCTGACCGRPLFVSGEARIAPAAFRGDWGGGAWRAAGSDDHLDAVTRERLAEAWLYDAQLEHASVASFARFTLDLLAAGAPPELVAEAQRASLDEVAHARLCFALASRYARKELGPGPLDLSGAGPSRSLAEAVAAAVREGCVGETIASVFAREQLRHATDPEAREALARIAEEEARHAELAWRFVGWALRVGGERVREAARCAFTKAIHAPFATATADGVDRAAWRAHGRLTREEMRAAERNAKRDVILPCARAVAELSGSDRGLELMAFS
jgi:hypothetical protein